MKLLIAPGAFRNALNSLEAAACMEQGVRRVLPDVETVRLPLADGGQGTVQAMLHAQGGKLLRRRVRGPSGRMVEAEFAVLSDGTGVMEIAYVSDLLTEAQRERNPLRATTYGTGELIRALLDRGCHTVVIGIGSGVAGDGGMGMARALGVRFLDRAGEELKHPGDLGALERIDLSGMDKRLARTRVQVVTDVAAPLCGPQGAVSKFRAPLFRLQEDTLSLLDNALRRFSQVVFGQLGLNIAGRPGMGAGGGLAYGLCVFCGAGMQPGVSGLLERLELEPHLRDCDLVLTGEGDIYESANHLSVSTAVATRAREAGIPAVALIGTIDAPIEELRQRGLDCIVSIINRPMLPADALDEADALLCDAAERAMRLVLLGRRVARRELSSTEPASAG